MKCVLMSYSAPRCPRTAASSSARTASGSSNERRVNSDCSRRILRRTISWIHASSTSSSRSSSAMATALRAVRKNVGERCSIVTWAQSVAIAGMSVAAVAPDPMTTTRLPA